MCFFLVVFSFFFPGVLFFFCFVGWVDFFVCFCFGWLSIFLLGFYWVLYASCFFIFLGGCKILRFSLGFSGVFEHFITLFKDFSPVPPWASPDDLRFRPPGAVLATSLREEVWWFGKAKRKKETSKL